ncbi:type II toxin-antitoxin system VapC family toxin [Staphylothermus hellenicus]|uniref:PilT protein domain protein n=1 Tax=Staphylothermus hellenicus (strain DSM 12710 / JCM 10830 / BK20S6-10-b1 / P8) TaxID=591019 RepID=D7D8C3_STAHD|nr:type II toxin-antitoxin system VapC family toxin [Staphylothermus hellenicus]ADI32019.1 hypothetical protein Shell_0911 [Staphylothermus hellenicus DSM 12710]
MSSATKKYLLDASAIYPLVLQLREDFLNYSKHFTILDLTVYEVGNVIWKMYRRGMIKNLGVVAKLFQEVLNSMAMQRTMHNIEEILNISIKENLTFYNASYLYIARTLKYKLVTEDHDLQKYPESISINQLLRELGIKPKR